MESSKATGSVPLFLNGPDMLLEVVYAWYLTRYTMKSKPLQSLFSQNSDFRIPNLSENEKKISALNQVNQVYPVYFSLEKYSFYIIASLTPNTIIFTTLHIYNM